MCPGLTRVVCPRLPPRVVALSVVVTVASLALLFPAVWAQDDQPPPPDAGEEEPPPPEDPPAPSTQPGFTVELPLDSGGEGEGQSPSDPDLTVAPPLNGVPPDLDGVAPSDDPTAEPSQEPAPDAEEPGQPQATGPGFVGGGAPPGPPPGSRTTPPGTSTGPRSASSSGNNGSREERPEPAVWQYDEFAYEEPAQPEAAPSLPSPAATASAASAPRQASYRRRTRPARSRRRSTRTARAIEKVAEESASPALYFVGFALLVSAFVVRLRGRGPSVEALRRAADVESLLTLLGEGSPAQRERGRDALLGLLTEAAEREDVQDVVAALRCSDATVQKQAASALCAIDTPEGIVATANAVRDYTERLPDDLRSEMMERLVGRDHSEVTEALLDGLHDRAPTIREVAYAHLYARVETLREQGATRQLARVMRRGDADLSAAALQALGESGNADAVAPLRELASDYSIAPEARAQAVEALQSLSAEEARSALEERLADFYPQVREAANRAMPDAEAPAGTGELDATREAATSRLYAALAANLEGRRAVDDEGRPVRWEDEALELGQQLQDSGGRELVYAVFHDLNRRLQESHGRSPRMLRLFWQQRDLW